MTNHPIEKRVVDAMLQANPDYEPPPPGWSRAMPGWSARLTLHDVTCESFAEGQTIQPAALLEAAEFSWDYLNIFERQLVLSALSEAQMANGAFSWELVDAALYGDEYLQRDARVIGCAQTPDGPFIDQLQGSPAHGLRRKPAGRRTHAAYSRLMSAELEDLTHRSQWSGLLSSMMPDVHLFEIPAYDAGQCIHEGRARFKRAAAARDGGWLPEDILKEFSSMPPLPFPSLFVGFGDYPLPLSFGSLIELSEDLMKSGSESLTSARNAGLLINESLIMRFYLMEYTDRRPFLFSELLWDAEEGWQVGHISSHPFWVPKLVEMLCRAPRKSMKPDHASRLSLREITHHTGTRIRPRPFYAVRPQRHRPLQGRIPMRPSSSLSPLSYRYDRRGHERCFIRRGSLPLDDRTRTKLAARGYRVYEGDDNLGGADAQRLLDRGKPLKAPDEWLAIKHTFIESVVCGDESLPYVPSIHLAKKHAAELRERSSRTTDPQETP